MSKKKKNSYAAKATRKNLLGLGSMPEPAASKSKPKIGRMLLSGVGGGLTGIVAGRGSLLIGLIVTGTGYYFGSPSTTMFGVGLMTSGGYQTVTGAVHGVEKDAVEGIKERFKNFTSGIKHQLFLDKLLPAKKEETTNGVPEVQYIDHANGQDVSGLDFTEADRIEQQIAESAQKFSAKQGEQVSGTGNTDHIEGVSDIEDKLY
jgi:hypothetical protein